MHGNASCRVEGYWNIGTILKADCHLLAFDFAGTGHSEGTFISLGYFEQHDLLDVIQHMKQFTNISKFILWGRSMGAATALLHMAKYHTPEVLGMICDSHFSSLEVQMNEMAD